MTNVDPFLRPYGSPAVLVFDARAPMRPPRRTRDGRVIGSAIRPSAGVRANYEARLRRLVDEMSASVDYWLRAAYRREEDRIEALAGDELSYIKIEDGSSGFCSPGSLTMGEMLEHRVPGCSGPSSLATDARPSSSLEAAVRRLRRRWLRRFDEASEDLARYFATAVWRRSDAELRRILKRGGISVKFRPGREARDALAAIVHENVSLIKSIPEQYLTQVEGSVMRSVLAGRDLESLNRDLMYHHGVSRRRAEFIALHQNNMASGAIQRLQYLDAGIERAIWRHSHAGKEPRPTHVANDGEEYDVRTGWYDPHERKHVRPGELINCRCYSQPVLPR